MSEREILAVGDVVKVAFPYADVSIVRRRPALVVAAPVVHARFSVIWVLMITSAQRVAWPGDVPISELSIAGLATPCHVRTEKIATIDTRFAEAIGRLSPVDRANVAARLHRMFDEILLGRH